jgi:hypothetical protein
MRFLWSVTIVRRCSRDQKRLCASSRSPKRGAAGPHPGSGFGAGYGVGCGSVGQSRRNYDKTLHDPCAFCVRNAVHGVAGRHGTSLSSTVNVRLSAVRKMVGKARRAGMLGYEEGASVTDVPNKRQKGTWLGNWLTREQTRELLAVPDRATLKGKRNYVILSLMVGCQQPGGRCVVADLEAKGRRIRIVAIPIC